MATPSSDSQPSGLKRPDDALDPDQPKRVKTGIISDQPRDTGRGKEKNISRRRDAAGYPKSRKGKEKDSKNIGRRRGMRQDGLQEDQEGSHREDHTPKAPRLPKRQCALLIGYCGTGCSGMQ